MAQRIHAGRYRQGFGDIANFEQTDIITTRK